MAKGVNMSIKITSDQTQGTTIGILDSGVGGLSVLLEIRKLLPENHVLYIGDSAWCPYGTKSSEQILERVSALTELLMTQGAQIIVIACNSATIHTIEQLRKRYAIPFVGMEPAIKPAAAATHSGVIGVLATEASLAGSKFHRLLDTHGEGAQVITTPCPEFVETVERGILEGEDVESSIDAITRPLLQQGVDTLVLGCTHYPFLKSTIQSLVGPEVRLIDTGEAVARRTKDLLIQRGGDSATEVFTTGCLEQLRRILPILCPSLQNYSTHFLQLSSDELQSIRSK